MITLLQKYVISSGLWMKERMVTLWQTETEIIIGEEDLYS